MIDETFDELVYIISGYTSQPIEERSRLHEDLHMDEAAICDLVNDLPNYFRLYSADHYRAVDGLLESLLDEAQTVGDLLSIIRRSE